MSDRFKEIIAQALAVIAEDFPAEADDPHAWHLTDKEIRDLLLRVAERVEEQMLDAVEVGRHMGQLSIERNEARAIARNKHKWLRRVAYFQKDGPTLTILNAEEAANPWLRAEGAEGAT